jgi:hypothetical protein
MWSEGIYRYWPDKLPAGDLYVMLVILDPEA